MPHLHLSLHNEEGEPRTLSSRALDEHEALALLCSADITGSQLVPWGSNYTFAVLLETSEGEEHLAIYKPRAGEAPLYDFPDGTLYLRETASYVLSRWLAWDIVPPTVVRDGPHGEGSVQLYITPAEDDDPDITRFWRRRHLDIERLVLFDYITNNADRKIGHCLRDDGGKIWGIDHGLTFNEYPKLRTVLWQFAGEPVSESLLDDLTRLADEWGEVDLTLTPYISIPERIAFRRRVERFLDEPRYPQLNPRRNIPYGW
jgi:uncharacterized repeat protein (TIGR03843 family)